MKIVRPYAKIIAGNALNGGVNIENPYAALRYIESCGRISHRSEDAQTADSWKRFIQAVVIEHGDWSIVEHISVSVDLLVDRGITHELVRHRLFSFTQESTRFVNYNKTKDGQLVNPPSFIYPKPEVECERCLAGAVPTFRFEVPGIRQLGDNWTHEPYTEDKVYTTKDVCAYEPAWLAAIAKAEAQYRYLVKAERDGGRGWRPQEARSVFPNALSSRIVMTGNLRNWRHFFIMRTTAEAHPQMRQVTIPLLAEFQQCFPILFDDIVPNEKQSEGMKKAR